MYSYTFRQWLSFFYLYCIFGWCFESAYVSLKQLRPVNRGFLKGPWLPLYGSGAILVLWMTLPFQNSPVEVYFVGMLGATVLEYLTGEAMVRLFKVRYWDYSNQHFQYKGHICLSSSIAWGFLSVAMVYGIQPQVERFVFWMNQEFVSVATFAITICIVYDFSGAFREAMDLRHMLEQAEQLVAELEQRAAEKKRLLEAASTFAKEAVSEKLADTKDALADTLSETKDALAERLPSVKPPDPAQLKEKMLERLEKEMAQLEERQEQLKERMTSGAEWFLTHNPGSRFMNAGIDRSAEIRERILKRKNTKSS